MAETYTALLEAYRDLYVVYRLPGVKEKRRPHRTHSRRRLERDFPIFLALCEASCRGERIAKSKASDVRIAPLADPDKLFTDSPGEFVNSPYWRCRCQVCKAARMTSQLDPAGKSG